MIVKQNVHQKRATRLTVEQCDQMARLFFNIVNCNCESVKIEPVNFCICIHFISQNNIFINLLNYNKRPLEAAFVQFEMLLLYLKVSSALNQGLYDFFVAKLDGAHQRSVVVPVTDVDTGSVLKQKNCHPICQNFASWASFESFYDISFARYYFAQCIVVCTLS